MCLGSACGKGRQNIEEEQVVDELKVQSRDVMYFEFLAVCLFAVPGVRDSQSITQA